MNYTPTNWTTGDVVTAAKLNKLEQGVASAGGGGGGLVVTVTNDALDKTWNEINAARLTGAVVLNGLVDDSGYNIVAYLHQIDAPEDNYYFAEFYYVRGAYILYKNYASDSPTGQMVSDD